MSPLKCLYGILVRAGGAFGCSGHHTPCCLGFLLHLTTRAVEIDLPVLRLRFRASDEARVQLSGAD